MPFMTADELKLAREHHMRNLQLLHQHSANWNAADRGRGEDTMADLMQQVYAIDAEILMAGAA